MLHFDIQANFSALGEPRAWLQCHQIMGILVVQSRISFLHGEFLSALLSCLVLPSFHASVLFSTSSPTSGPSSYPGTCFLFSFSVQVRVMIIFMFPKGLRLCPELLNIFSSFQKLSHPRDLRQRGIYFNHKLTAVFATYI